MVLPLSARTNIQHFFIENIQEFKAPFFKKINGTYTSLN